MRARYGQEKNLSSYVNMLHDDFVFFPDSMSSLPGSQVRWWSSGGSVQTNSFYFSENIDL